MDFNWDSANADQLVWEAEQIGMDKRLCVSAACAGARVVLPLTREQDRQVHIHALETAERWTRGEATDQECRRARNEAKAAATRAGTAHALLMWDAGHMNMPARERAALKVETLWAWAACFAEEACAEASDRPVVAVHATANATRNAAQQQGWSEESRVHNAARAVLTHDALIKCKLRCGVIGKKPTEQQIAQWDRAVESRAMQKTLADWFELEMRAVPGSTKLQTYKMFEDLRELMMRAGPSLVKSRLKPGLEAWCAGLGIGQSDSLRTQLIEDARRVMSENGSGGVT